MAGLPIAITQAPMRTVRPKMLRDAYANPEKELVRLRDEGRLIQIARGTYIAKPDSISPSQTWQPRLETMAMAYATAAYGDRVPILYGLGAARVHHAIPRAINVTVIAVPASHREVRFYVGGRAVFTVRDVRTLDARPEPTELGPILVTTPEQTLIDLIRHPDLGAMEPEARPAIQNLLDQVDRKRVNRLLATLPASVHYAVTERLEGR